MKFMNYTMAADGAGMFVVRQTVGSVLCCKCGIPMQPNSANMCVKCLRSEVDITEGLKKHMIIRHCPECDTYLQPPNTWIRAQLESKQLLAFCLKALHLPKTVRMVNAEFVWTEPHSKRIKLRLKIQKEVLAGAVLEQTFDVEFVQQETMCNACTRVQANPDQWVASVQLRQHVPHRRTFFYLEQLILKYGAAVHAIKINQMDHGIDFFFGNQSHGERFVQFIRQYAPVKHRNAEQLVSHDTHTNTCNYKCTSSVEISPICREDLICLPPKVGCSLGNFGPIVICTKVTKNIALLDPLTLRQCCLNADQYWRAPFKSLLTSRQLVEYIVLDVETTGPEVDVGGSKYALAEAQVARLSDFGRNNNIFFVKTHLGHILKPGDRALGYDLYAANINNYELDKCKGLVLPEAILIRKSYEEKHQRKCGKPHKTSREYEEFLRDLEEDPELRFNISLVSTVDGEELPSSALDELLADLDISDMERDEDDVMSE
ncbi:uncharacterized protein [Euphorbia lathyris]|uniref:uncharacterized protein n=1 Tax=Euphorbia lathyris TaxID=212925 RepID=UPI003313D299